MTMRKIPFFALVLTGLVPAFGSGDGPCELGERLSDAAFWKSDPVLFVRRNVEAGFQFTSDSRVGADSRLDGGVTCFGLPAYETKVSFGEAGGVDRVEVVLYAGGGTEILRKISGPGGKRYLRRERLEKSMTREEFFKTLATVRAQLTAPGAKPPAVTAERVKAEDTVQMSQAWPRSDVPTRATLVWNYAQHGRDKASFRPGFIRLAVDGPARLAAKPAKAGAKAAASGAAKIADRVVRDPRGDVFLDGVPMVDQGQKGYCAVATAERVLRYYGVDVDEHELAAAAGTTAEGGTSTIAMKQSVEAIGKKYRLATVVAYGDFEKGVSERIAGLADEVKAYNKAAKRLKKQEIADSVYISRRGNVITYSPSAVDQAMDPEVRKEMKVFGSQKAKFTKFQKDIRDQIAKGIPLIWSVTLGIYPEPGIPQTAGGHMRLVIGYNDKKRELLYSDSWGAGHELKRMPIDWAWTISRCLMYMKPLVR